MNTERLANIIVSPRVSEKATTRADFENQHVFSIPIWSICGYGLCICTVYGYAPKAFVGGAGGGAPRWC